MDSINYVISAHGSDTKQSWTKFQANGEILFYVKDGENLSCPLNYQTRVCTGTVPAVETIVNNGYYYSSLLFIRDMNGQFKSGIVDCKTKIPIYSLEHNPPINLRQAVEIVKLYHDSTYGSHIQFRLHILTCGTNNKVISKSGSESDAKFNLKYNKSIWNLKKISKLIILSSS